MPSRPHVDHVLLGISNLDAGVREFESLTGIHAVYGGEHPHLGTHNALVSLGEQTYLEIIAPNDNAALNPDFVDLMKLDHLTPVGWAVSMDDAVSLREELAASGIKLTEPRPGSRKTPSGAVLEWQTAGIESSVDSAPFFIHWKDLQKHPAKTSPHGCTLTSIAFDDPHDADLARITHALAIDYAIRNAEKAAMTITIQCGERTIRFPHANP